MEKNNANTFKKFIERETSTQGIEKISQPFYSKSGFLIEFKKINKDYWVYILIKILVFLVDFAIPFSIQFVLWKILDRSILFSSMITMFYYHVYFFICFISTKGRSIGMIISGCRVVHKSGFSTSFVNYYFRALVSSPLSLPFIGWGLIVLNFIVAIFMRGVTLVGLISQTIVVTKKTYNELQIIERTK